MKEFDLEKFRNDLLRLRGKETQSKFAEKLDINRSTLSLLETGKQIPSLEILNKVCSLGGYEVNSYFLEKNSNALIYLMGNLDEPDKERINELMERIKIIEKYEALYRRCKDGID